MSVSILIKSHKIFCVLLHDVLHLVLIFKGGFDELTLKRKSMLFIADISTDLSRISLEVHKYNSDLDAALPSQAEYVSSPESTFPPDAQTYATFMDVANKTKMTCKKAANEEEKAILEARTKETVELLRGAKFPLWRFKLNRQHAPLMVAEVANAIGLKYGRLSM